MMKKLIIILTCFLLTACGATAGNYSEKLGTFGADDDLQLAEKHGITGSKRPVKLRSRESTSVGVSKYWAKAIESQTKLELKKLDLEIARLSNNVGSNSCFTVSEQSFNDMESQAKQEYIRHQDRCASDSRYTSLLQTLAASLAKANERGSDIQSTNVAFGATVQNISTQRGLTIRSVLNNAFNFVSAGLISFNSRRERESTNDAFRDIASSGFGAAGDTIVGDISLVTGQSGSADSNDAAGGSGELGGAATASGTTSQTSTDVNPVTFIFGDNNQFAFSEGESVSFAPAGNANNAAESAAALQLDTNNANANNTDGNVETINGGDNEASDDNDLF